MVLNKPVVGMAAVPGGGGYWLVASDGGIFSFGSGPVLRLHGQHACSTSRSSGMAATADGGGYWLVASDGGIFAFGDAAFHGSTGSLVLNKPVVGMIAGPGGAGYFLVASDGGIFSFGSAPFYGSLGGVPLKHPIVAAAATPTFNGYWFTDSTGLVSNFGQASYYGSAPSPLFRPIVGMAEAPGTGASSVGPTRRGPTATTSATSSATSFPTADHAISIVQVDGESLRRERTRASPRRRLGRRRPQPLHLPDLRDLGDERARLQRRRRPAMPGYQAGIHAYNDAVSAGVNAGVPWWLDVETNDRIPAWSSKHAGERRLRPGRPQCAARDRRRGRRRHLCQSRRLEHHRRRLRAVGPVLDGRLPGFAQRTGLAARTTRTG